MRVKIQLDDIKTGFVWNSSKDKIRLIRFAERLINCEINLGKFMQLRFIVGCGTKGYFLAHASELSKVKLVKKLHKVQDFEFKVIEIKQVEICVQSFDDNKC